MEIELPSVRIPAMISLDHNQKGFPNKDIDSAVYLVESRLDADLPIVCYEDMRMILKHLKNYQALIHDLYHGGYYS